MQEKGLNDPTTPFQAMKDRIPDESNSDDFKSADPSLYPEADDEGLVVIGALDDAILVAEEEVSQPVVDEEDIGPPVRCTDAIEKFKFPLIALSIAAISGILVIFSSNPLLYEYFPYFACLVNFCGGIPSTKNSLDSAANAIIPRLQDIEKKVHNSASRSRRRASAAYSKYTGFVQKKKEKLMDKLSTKLPAGFKKNTLKQYDPPADIEASLDTKEVTGHAESDVENVGETKPYRSKYIPIWFQSKSHFDLLVTFPIFMILFIIQMSIVTYFRLLKGISPSDEPIDNKWSPLMIAGTTSIMVLIQIFIAHNLTKASRVAKNINKKAKKRFGELNFFKRNMARCIKMLKTRLVAMLKSFKKTIQLSSGFTKALGFGKEKVKKDAVVL